jgi:hypothetical protein
MHCGFILQLANARSMSGETKLEGDEIRAEKAWNSANLVAGMRQRKRGGDPPSQWGMGKRPHSFLPRRGLECGRHGCAKTHGQEKTQNRTPFM